jgi:hypothetical protein
VASPLFPLLQKIAQDEWIKLDQNQIAPWAFFNSGKFQITDFFGKVIASHGIEFSGSIRDLFWENYIEPFLEDIVDRSFTETLRLARDRSQLFPDPFEEMGGQLVSLARKAFTRMAGIDQRLRGNGYPESVPRYNPDNESAKISEFIQRRMQAEIKMLPSTQSMEAIASAAPKGNPWEGLSEKLDEIQSALDGLEAQSPWIGHNQPPAELVLEVSQVDVSEAMSSIKNLRRALTVPENANAQVLELAATRFQSLRSAIVRLTGKIGSWLAKGAVIAIVGEALKTWLAQNPQIGDLLASTIDAILRWVGWL